MAKGGSHKVMLAATFDGDDSRRSEEVEATARDLAGRIRERVPTVTQPNRRASAGGDNGTVPQGAGGDTH
ncbi:MAG: hypothetical protein AB7I59_04120 [Geminicoccaceae bacterium]